MLGWAAVFLVIALIAGAFAFTGLGLASAAVAKVIFFVFLGLCALTLVARAFRDGRR